MNYNIKGTGLQITDEIRTYVEKRLANVDRFAGGKAAVHTDVELQLLPGEGGMYRAEFTCALSSEVFRAESKGTTLHEAIDVAANELTHEVTRAKKKRLHAVRRGALRFKDFIRGLRDRS